jgi:DNA-binding MarR family transcriptional regulator
MRRATKTPPARRLGPEELAAWRGFLRAHTTVLQELDAELIAAHALPLASYDVLTQLESAPDRSLRMRDLADAVLLSRSGLTRLVDRLARAGLVRRQCCPDDGRGLLAVLTDDGLAALHEARPTHLAGVRRLFLEHLDAQETEALGEVWDRIDPPETDSPLSD